MKRFSIILFMMWQTLAACALHVVAYQGKACHQLVNGSDTLLLFASAPELSTVSSVGEVDWYRLPDTITPYASGTDYLAGEHAAGYRIKVNNQWEEFWVLDYDSLRLRVDSVIVDTTCETSILHLFGDLPAIEYKTIQGITRLVNRTCGVSYTDAQWSTDTWTNVEKDTLLTLRRTLYVTASPVETDYAVYDPLASKVGVTTDSVFSTMIAPAALRIYPEAITTKRGETEENEIHRPIDEGARSDISAPLEILFKANGLNVDHYRWAVYKDGATEPYFTRSDAEHRYTFSDFGNYEVILVVSNSHEGYIQCVDSASFTVSITKSFLWVPNMFTPNGDGTNDEFRVAYSSLREFHCWVYNRWGTLVYQWTDPAKGWDGTIGGRPAAEGAYYYVIRAMGTDAPKGSEYTWKPTYKNALKKNPDSLVGIYQLSGSINLLRGGK